MKRFPNWIINHSQNAENETNEKHYAKYKIKCRSKQQNIINKNVINKYKNSHSYNLFEKNFKIENKLYSESKESRPYNSAISIKNRKLFKEDNTLQSNIFKLANCFHNAGLDCLKQRFLNFVPIPTTLIPCCFNLYASAKLLIQYILLKFNISYSNDENFSLMFSKLPDEIQSFLIQETHIESHVFLEIVNEVHYDYYLTNKISSNKHIFFYLKFVGLLKSICHSINQNVYYL